MAPPPVKKQKTNEEEETERRVAAAKAALNLEADRRIATYLKAIQMAIPALTDQRVAEVVTSPEEARVETAQRFAAAVTAIYVNLPGEEVQRTALAVEIQAEANRRVAAVVSAIQATLPTEEQHVVVAVARAAGAFVEEKAEAFAEGKAEGKAEAAKNYSVLAVLKSNDFQPIKALQCSGTKSSHLYPDNLPAEFTLREFQVHEVYPLCNVPEFKYQHLPSTLLSHPQNEYDKESDLHLFVNHAIIDAIKICNEMIRMTAERTNQESPIQLQWRTESTLFSNIIDHVVIYDRKSNVPIFAVESKKHLPESFAKNSPQKILGQCFDQLQEMKLMGHRCPFGALTSFNETIITWLDSDIHTKILEDHSKNGMCNQLLLNEIIDDSESNAPMGSQSPPKLVSDEDQAGPLDSLPEKRSLRSTQHQAYTGKIHRSIVFSTRRFKQDELVDVLVNAVFCSMDGYLRRPETIKKFKSDKPVTARDAIVLTRKKYEWLNVHQKPYLGPLTEGTYNQKSESTESGGTKMYLVSYLGMGATSKVYQGISETGHDCVVKLFVQRRDEGNKIMPRPEFIKYSTNLAKKEEGNFKLIYPELSEYVWRDELNNLQCLIMPLFTPIPKKERTSEAVTTGIREKLQRFGRAGKMFRPYDQLWRHVGYFNNEIYLFDLGDLIDIGDGELTAFIDMHLNRLAERAKAT